MTENTEIPQDLPEDPSEAPPFEFEIELTAKTCDPGGINQSFVNQLNELGGTAVLIRQVPPYRVDSSSGYWFETRRLYRVTL